MAFTSETAREAGKKSRRGTSVRAKILNDLFTEVKAKEVFQKLEEKAVGGDMEAIKTYLAYCFGKPEANLDITTDGEQIGSDLSRLTPEQLLQLREIKESIMEAK